MVEHSPKILVSEEKATTTTTITNTILPKVQVNLNMYTPFTL